MLPLLKEDSFLIDDVKKMAKWQQRNDEDLVNVIRRPRTMLHRKAEGKKTEQSVAKNNVPFFSRSDMAVLISETLHYADGAPYWADRTGCLHFVFAALPIRVTLHVDSRVCDVRSEGTYGQKVRDETDRARGRKRRNGFDEH